MACKLIGDWKKLDRRLEGMPGHIDRVVAVLLRRIAQIIVKAAKMGIINTREGWAPLKKATIKKKGSSKPLFDHGDLMRSIQATSVGKDTMFVGVHRNERKSDGTELVDIAAVHEYGYPQGGIPARPFIAPTIKETEPENRREVRDAGRAIVKGRKYP